MKGKNLRQAAEQEALEEAGVLGDLSKKPIGVYHYLKRIENGTDIPCEVVLYPMRVTKLLRKWQERDERKRKWFSVKGAAKRVLEPDLSDLLLKIKDDHKALGFQWDSFSFLRPKSREVNKMTTEHIHKIAIVGVGKIAVDQHVPSIEGNSNFEFIDKDS